MSVANEPNGVYKVDPAPQVKLSVRITLEEKDVKKGFKLAKLYNERWNVINYIWSYELSDKDIPHLHGYVEMKNKPAKASMSDWMKTVKYKKQGDSTYWHDNTKDYLKHNSYILKDGEYITNLDTDTINEILKKVDETQKNMNTKAYHKLLQLIEPKIKLLDEENVKKYKTTREIKLAEISQMIIDIYTNEWNKPAPFFKIKEYAIYIAQKLNLAELEIKLCLEKMF